MTPPAMRGEGLEGSIADGKRHQEIMKQSSKAVFDSGDWQSHSRDSCDPNNCEDGLLWEVPDFQVTQLDG